MDIKNKNYEKKHSFLDINSYSISQGLINFSVGAFGSYAFFFYETEMKLNVIFLGIVFAIYSIWDAINEPLLGNLTDRPFKFTARWGRRLPWVVIGFFPWILLYILIFTPPVINGSYIPWITFIYVFIIIVLYDTFYTLWSVNSEALFPFKYRDFQERRKVSGIRGFWGVIGLVMGLLIPPLIVVYEIKETYVLQAIILGIASLIFGILMFPGHREDKNLTELYLKSPSSQHQGITFFKDLWSALKKKNFLVMLILHFMYTVLTSLLIASLNYFVKYNLKMESTALFFGMSGYLIASLLSIPLWIRVANKVNNNKKIMTYGALSMSFTTGILFIANSLITLMVLGCFVGLTGAIFFVMQDTINADVLDEATVLDKSRTEGTYYGVKFFIGRFADVFKFLTLAVVHISTGFIADTEVTQSTSALIGIKLHMSIIPAIALFIGAIIFWKWYDLEPKKMEKIRLKIKELDS